MTKKRLLTVFSAIVVLTLAVRFFLQFSEIDLYNGFYYANDVSDAWSLGFLALLFAAVVAVVVMVWRFKPAAARPEQLHTRSLALTQIALGLVAEVGAYFTGFSVLMAILGGYRISLGDAAVSGLTVLGGLVMIVIGLATLSNKQNTGGLFAAIVVIIWMALNLIFTFMSYPIVLNVSDNMLHILALASATAFFLYYFKVLVGVGSQRDTSTAIVLGLLTAYFGVTLVIPRFVVRMVTKIYAFVPSVSSDDLLLVAVLTLIGFFAALALMKPAEAVPAVETPEQPAADEQASEEPTSEAE